MPSSYLAIKDSNGKSPDSIASTMVSKLSEGFFKRQTFGRDYFDPRLWIGSAQVKQ